MARHKFNIENHRLILFFNYLKSYFIAERRDSLSLSLSPCTLKSKSINQSKLWRLISAKTRAHNIQARARGTRAQNSVGEQEKHPREEAFLLHVHKCGSSRGCDGHGVVSRC